MKQRKCKCLHCKKEMEYRSSKKFCNHSCRGSYHTDIRRLKEKKLKEQTLINSVPSSIDAATLYLYNLINK